MSSLRDFGVCALVDLVFWVYLRKSRFITSRVFREYDIKRSSRLNGAS